MASSATSIVAYLFTDIVDSTAKWAKHRSVMDAAQQRHDGILCAAITNNRGRVFGRPGDAFCAQFPLVSLALAATVEAERALQQQDWTAVDGLTVRYGIHVGAPDAERDGNHFGHNVNLAARVAGLAHGGQILLSNAAAALAHDDPSPGLTIRYLQPVPLKGMPKPERVHQVCAPGFRHDFPPLAAPTTPPIWHVPQALNPAFTGRESELDSLAISLRSDRAAVVTQAVTGLGGMGKSQLAVAYAWRHAVDAADYDVVWWVPSEEPAALAAEYAALSQPLFLVLGDDPTQEQQIAAVRRWLSTHPRWLLIFDNAPDLTAVRPYLPDGRVTHGHAVITSRSQFGWRPYGKPLALDTFPRDDSVRFLRERTGRLDDPGANELAELLGDFPLALEQAASYVDATAMSFSSYATFFRAQPGDALTRGVPTDYPATVATTWQLAFDALRQSTPAAVDLLSLCAFLAPEAIPLALVATGATHLPEPLASVAADAAKLNDVVAQLRRFSLVERSGAGDSLSVHRMV